MCCLGIALGRPQFIFKYFSSVTWLLTVTSFKVVAAFTKLVKQLLLFLMLQRSWQSWWSSAAWFPKIILLWSWYFQIVPAWSYTWDLLKMSCAALQANYIDLCVSQGISLLPPWSRFFTSGPIKGMGSAVIVTRFELGLPSYVICLRQPTPTPDQVFLLQSDETGK